MNKNFYFMVATLLVIAVPSSVFALSITPSSISVNMYPAETKYTVIKVTNDINNNQLVNLKVVNNNTDLFCLFNNTNTTKTITLSPYETDYENVSFFVSSDAVTGNKTCNFTFEYVDVQGIPVTATVSSTGGGGCGASHTYCYDNQTMVNVTFCISTRWHCDAGCSNKTCNPVPVYQPANIATPTNTTSVSNTTFINSIPVASSDNITSNISSTNQTQTNQQPEKQDFLFWVVVGVVILFMFAVMLHTVVFKQTKNKPEGETNGK